MKRFRLSYKEKELTDKIVKKFLVRRKSGKGAFALFRRVELERLLTPNELVVADKFLEINLDSYGIKMPFIGVVERKYDFFVPIRNQRYVSKFDGKKKVINTQYLPRRPFGSFEKMVLAMRADMGRGILILSGYRSPWYQLLVFIKLYAKNQYRVSRTLKLVALPGYTQHGDHKNTAFDVVTERGVYKGKHFSKTDEYTWLKKNAKQFGFLESYPRDSSEGISYEPWHWRYVG